MTIYIYLFNKFCSSLQELSILWSFRCSETLHRATNSARSHFGATWLAQTSAQGLRGHFGVTGPAQNSARERFGATSGSPGSPRTRLGITSGPLRSRLARPELGSGSLRGHLARENSGRRHFEVTWLEKTRLEVVWRLTKLDSKSFRARENLSRD